MNTIQRYIVIGFVVCVISFILWYFKNIVAYLLISAVLALIGKPIVEFLGKVKYKKFQIPKSIRALLTLVAIWFAVITFFKIFIPLITNQADELAEINVNSVIENLKEPISKVENVYNNYKLDNTEDFSIEAYVKEKLASLFSFNVVTNLFSQVAAALGNIFVAVFSISFITFFFLKDETLFADGIMLLVPTKHEASVGKALISIRYLLRRYFLGICLQVTGIIILITLGMTIIGVGFRQGLVIGLIVGIFNIIPYVGPLMGSALGLIVGISTHLELNFVNELMPLLGYMALVFVVVQIVDNILFQPIIYSSSVHAHPLEIFLVIMTAGSLAGIPGMILATPVYTILRVFSKEFFNHLKVVKKLTENIK